MNQKQLDALRRSIRMRLEGVPAVPLQPHERKRFRVETAMRAVLDDLVAQGEIEPSVVGKLEQIYGRHEVERVELDREILQRMTASEPLIATMAKGVAAGLIDESTLELYGLGEIADIIRSRRSEFHPRRSVPHGAPEY